MPDRHLYERAALSSAEFIRTFAEAHHAWKHATLGALLIVDALAGVGPATASAFLAAQDPDGYTVMDPRAWSSLEAFKIVRGPYLRDEPWQRRQWKTYLDACRAVAHDVGKALRQVDRALFQAKGRTSLPGDQTRGNRTHHG